MNLGRTLGNRRGTARAAVCVGAFSVTLARWVVPPAEIVTSWNWISSACRTIRRDGSVSCRRGWFRCRRSARAQIDVEGEIVVIGDDGGGQALACVQQRARQHSDD